MADKFKILKAGALAVPAFFISGCENAPPMEIQHLLWFFGHPEIFLPLAAITLGPLIYGLLKKFGRPRGIPALWLWGGLIFIAAVILTGLKMQGDYLGIASHDVYYITAHYNAAIAPVLAFVFFGVMPAVFRKIFRFDYSRTLAKLNFWLFFIGIALVWLPQFYIGFKGMPRRYVDYSEDFKIADIVAGLGMIFVGLSALAFIILIIEALIKKRPYMSAAARTAGDTFT